MTVPHSREQLIVGIMVEKKEQADNKHNAIKVNRGGGWESWVTEIMTAVLFAPCVCEKQMA